MVLWKRHAGIFRSKSSSISAVVLLFGGNGRRVSRQSLEHLRHLTTNDDVLFSLWEEEITENGDDGPQSEEDEARSQSETDDARINWVFVVIL